MLSESLPVRYAAGDDARKLFGVDAADGVIGVDQYRNAAACDRKSEQILIVAAQRARHHANVCTARAYVSFGFSASTRLDIDFRTGVRMFEAPSQICHEGIE